MKLIALSPIQHDGEPYGEGETLEVSEKDGKALVEAGVAKEVKAGKAKAEGGQG